MHMNESGINVLFCFEYFPYPERGGISNVSIRLSRYFREKCGMKCYCLCTVVEQQCRNLDVFDGYIVIENNRTAIPEIRKYIENKQINILLFQVVWNIKLFELLHSARRGTDCRMVSAIHGLPGQFFYNLKKYIEQEKPRSCKERIIKYLKPLYLLYVYHKFRRYNHFIYNQSDACVVLTGSNKKSYVDFYRIGDTRKFTIIPNPLSYDEFATYEEICTKEQVVLVVARFEEGVKRLSYALKIWHRLECKGVDGWRLVIVGDGDDRELYLELSRQLGLKNISFEGRRNPLEYYRKAAVFMMTSLFEGFGVTLTEAQQMGVVPMAMDSFDAVHDIIVHGESGLIIPDNDLDTYAESLYQLLADKAYREQLALNATVSSKNFSIDTVAFKWCNLFKSLVYSCRDRKKE